MKTAVIGSRTFNDYSLLCKVLKDFDITHVVSGGAAGADSMAVQWALDKQIPYTEHVPNWMKYGKAAGFIRNADIIADSELVIAFWNGFSKGTENSINIAKTRGVPVYIEMV